MLGGIFLIWLLLIFKIFNLFGKTGNLFIWLFINKAVFSFLNEVKLGIVWIIFLLSLSYLSSLHFKNFNGKDLRVSEIFFDTIVLLSCDNGKLFLLVSSLKIFILLTLIAESYFVFLGYLTSYFSRALDFPLLFKAFYIDYRSSLSLS